VRQLALSDSIGGVIKWEQTQAFYIFEVFAIAGQEWQAIHQGDACD
jgi:hypothetical protein